jgi:hypothetical protein
MRKSSGMLILLALLSTSPVLSKDNGQWGDVPDNVRSWFKSIRSPHGVPCCDISDGHRTPEEWRSNNTYWIPNPAARGPIEWMQVPPEAVVYNAGNPTGEAVVWYVWQTPNQVFIRCFVPGGGV